MSFTGIAFEMAAIDDGMFKAVKKATDFVSGMNDVLRDQVGRIRSIKKEDFYGAMERGVKVASKSVNRLMTQFDAVNGIEKTVTKSAVDGFGDVNKSVKHLDRGIGEMANKMKSRLGEAFSKGKKDGESFFESLKKRADRFNLADIASNMKALTGDTGNLSNDLERQMASMVQTTRPIIANLNLSSAEIKKMSGKAAGIAYGMNTDAGSVAETMKSMMTANKGAKATLDAMGMSTKDWVKVVQTANVKMDDMTTIMGDLTTSWNMAPKQAAGLIDSIVAVGKVAGVGTLPLQNVKELLGEMGTIFGKLPPGMQRTADDMEKLIESTVRGAGVFKEFGASESEAVTKSNAVAKMFASQAVAMNQAFDIGGKEAASDTPLFKYLIQLGLGYDGARDIIETGSRDVVAGMGKLNKVYATFGESQLYQTKQVLGGLNESLGEGASGLEFLAMSTDKGTDAIAKFSNMTVDSTKALEKHGNAGYSSGLTLQDGYDRAKLAFDSVVRSIARANVKDLVGKQMAGIKEAGKDLTEMSKDEKWGPWINAMSQFKQMGMGGVFASAAESMGIGAKNAAKFGTKAGLVFDTVSDVGKDLAPIMHMVGMTGPFGPLLAAGGIAGLLIMDEKSSREVLGPMYDIVSKFKDKLIKIWDEWGPKLGKIWHKDIVPFLKTNIPKAFSFIWDEVGDSFGTKGQVLFGAALVSALGAAPVMAAALGLGSSLVGPLAAALGPGGIIAVGVAGLIAMIISETDKIEEMQKNAQTKASVMELAADRGRKAWKEEMSSLDKKIMEAYASKSETTVDALVSAGITAKSLSSKGGANFDPEMFSLRNQYLQDRTVSKDKVSGNVLKLLDFSKGKQAAMDLARFKLQQEEDTGVMGPGGKMMKAHRTDEEKNRLINIAGNMAAKGDVSVAQSEFMSNMEKLMRLQDAQSSLERVMTTNYKNGGDRVSALQGLLSQYSAQIQTLEASDWGLMGDGPMEAGYETAEKTATGYAAGAEVAKGIIQAAQTKFIAPSIGQSLPTEGPLAGGIGAYEGGYETMMSFSDGIAAGGDLVKTTVTKVMEDSVLTSIDVYATKMQQLAEQKTLLESVAKSIVNSMGGKIDTTIDTDADVNVKKNFQASLSIPGLAGVILAICTEGAQTRKMLKKIHDESVVHTSLMRGGKVVGGSGSSVYIPAP